MHIIVVGGGPVGDALLQLGLAEGHHMVLIEAEAEIAEAAAQKHDALILHASITTDDIMDEAGAAQADALIATTGDDAANLMAMVLGQEAEIDCLTCVVNHASHRGLFERLEVQILSDPETLVARHLLGMVLHPSAADVTSVGEQAQIYALELAAGSPLVGKPLREIGAKSLLPNESFIVSVEREGKRFFPRDSTALQAGDLLLVFARDSLSDQSLAAFTDEQ